MADPKRLGKRGAYRFGELRAPERPVRRHVPHEPTFGPHRSRAWILVWLVACAATAALLALGARFGLWFVPFVAGVAAGAGPWRARPALSLVVLAVAVGWGAALWRPTRSGAPIGATARVVAALAGLPPYAAVGVAGTLLVGIVQAVVAFWLARAVTYGLRQRAAVLTGGRVIRRRCLLAPVFAGAGVCWRRCLLAAVFAGAGVCWRRCLPATVFASGGGSQRRW